MTQLNSRARRIRSGVPTPMPATRGFVRAILVGVLALSISACASTAGSTPAGESPRSPGALRIMTYNVCAEAANCPDLRAWDAGRADAVAAAVKTAAPDVLTVEEVGRKSVEVATFKKALAPEYELVSGGRSRYVFVRAGQVTVYDSGQFEVQARGKADGSSVTRDACAGHKARKSDSKPQCTAWALLSRRGSAAKVAVVGVHLTAFDGTRNDLDREGEMRAIMRAMPRLVGDHGWPVVIAGDFNSYRQRPEAGVDVDDARYRVHDFLTSKGMVDAVSVAASTVNAERNTLNPEPTDTRNFGVGHHLDHVYVPASMTVDRWAVIDTPGAYADQASDHDPLVVDLAW